jgi:high-affinity Fe2+/Pb2+ permease
MPDVFSVPIFLVTFREALETVIIVSVLLAFLKQTLDNDKALHKRLVRQVRPLPTSSTLPHPPSPNPHTKPKPPLTNTPSP